MQKVYVRGYNARMFRFSAIVGQREMSAPTLWSWRVDPPVNLPFGEITGEQLGDWVEHLMKNGHTIYDVTTST